jgi:hypothetical protein
MHYFRVNELQLSARLFEPSLSRDYSVSYWWSVKVYGDEASNAVLGHPQSQLNANIA